MEHLRGSAAIETSQELKTVRDARKTNKAPEENQQKKSGEEDKHLKHEVRMIEQ